MPASAYFSFYPLSALRATSPTRRTRPFCRYRDISPVSAGESTPKEEAKLHVILNEVKNPTEELTGISSSLWSWDISLALNMTCFSTLPGDCVANCYSALNACALKLSFSAFFIKNASAL